MEQIKDETEMTDSNGQLVLEQHYYRLAQLDKANDVLDNKAMSFLQITVGILALVGLFAPDASLFFIPFGLALILSAYTLFPKDAYSPGSSDWEIIDRDYIYTKDYSLLQVLSDCVETGNRLAERNRGKSEAVAWIFYLSVIQVLVLIAAILFAKGL